MKLYWPQHKVYLYGQLDLCPEKLEGQATSRRELAHYFAADDVRNLLDELRAWEREGYFKVEATLDAGYLKWERDQEIMQSRSDMPSTPYELPDIGDVRQKVAVQAPLTTSEVDRLISILPRNKFDENLRFKLTDIDGQRIHTELSAYLTDYQQNELSTGQNTCPEDFTIQHSKLLQAVQGKGARTIVSQPDVITPTFWELILTHHLLTGEVEVRNMGYDDTPARKVTPGVWTVARNGTVPFAELNVSSELLLPTAQTDIVAARPKAGTGGSETQSVTVGITVEGAIYADFGVEKRLIKKVRRDSAAYNFINHMLGHQKQDVPRGDIQTAVYGCAGKKDMTELAKLCGFTKDLQPLKAVYFGGTTATKVRFRATASLTSQQVELLMQREKLIT